MARDGDIIQLCACTCVSVHARRRSGRVRWENHVDVMSVRRSVTVILITRCAPLRDTVSSGTWLDVGVLSSAYGVSTACSKGGHVQPGVTVGARVVGVMVVGARVVGVNVGVLVAGASVGALVTIPCAHAHTRRVSFRI